MATKAMEMDPAPRPTTTPHSNHSCQGWVMRTVSPLPLASRSSATVRTGRIPKRSISAAAKGENRPKSTRLMDTAIPMVPCDHPNSVCSGSMSTPGTDRNPAAPTIATKPARATHQARCTRGARAPRVGLVRSGEAGDVIPPSWVTPDVRTSGGEADMCQISAMTTSAPDDTDLRPHRVAVLCLPRSSATTW